VLVVTQLLVSSFLPTTSPPKTKRWRPVSCSTAPCARNRSLTPPTTSSIAAKRESQCPHLSPRSPPNKLSPIILDAAAKTLPNPYPPRQFPSPLLHSPLVRPHLCATPSRRQTTSPPPPGYRATSTTSNRILTPPSGSQNYHAPSLALPRPFATSRVSMILRNGTRTTWKMTRTGHRHCVTRARQA